MESEKNSMTEKGNKRLSILITLMITLSSFSLFFSTTTPVVLAEKTKPTAHAGGPYVGYINASITFNGSKSKDSDGNIIGYRWDFTNDGIYDTDWLPVPTTISTYTSVGGYTVKLQVKDNDNVTGNATANVTIKPLPIIYASTEAMNVIQMTFGLQFTRPFYATDTNGDNITDTFTDPNHLLTLVHFVKISRNVSFLLSTGNDMIPEFFWDTKANKIVLLTFISIQMTETWIDSEDRIISSDMIWRENGNIYILDDSSQQYILTYGYTILPPIFNPSNGTLLKFARPTVTITFLEKINLTIATFNDNDILDQITTIDYKTIIFSPTLDLTDGTYALNLTVQDDEANTLTSTSTYTIITEKIPTAEFPWLIITLIAIILIIVVILVILRMRLII